MGLIKKNYFIVAYFTPNTTAQEMVNVRNQVKAQLASLGFADAEMIIRGPFDFSQPNADGSDTTEVKIAIAEVRP